MYDKKRRQKLDAPDILKVLKLRFTKDAPSKIVEKLNQIEHLPCLDEIFDKAVTVKSIAEFRSFLKQVPDNHV